MLCRFLRFGFDVELPLKADGLLMVHCQVKEAAEMLHLALEVSVQESAVALASAPEHVAGPVERVSHLDGLFDLGGGVGKNIGVATGCGAVRESRMRKQACCTPEQPYAGALLLLFQHLDDGIQVLDGLA